MKLKVLHTSTTTSSFKVRQYVPPQTEFDFTVPFPRTYTSDEGLALKEACACGNHQIHLQPPGTAHGNNFDTDATLFNGLAPPRTGSQQDLASDPLRYVENVDYVAHPPLTTSAINGRNCAAPPPVFNPSIVSTRVDGIPRIKLEHCELPSTSYTSNPSAPRCLAPKLPSHEFSGASPLHRPYDFEALATPLVSVTQPRNLPKELTLKSVNPPGTSASSCPTPHGGTSGCVNPSTTLVPGHSVVHAADPNSSKLLDTSAEDAVDPDDPFSVFTHQHDNSGDDCDVGGFSALDAPNVSHQDTPDASEACTTEGSVGQPCEIPGVKEVSKPRRQYRKRKMVDAFPALPKPHRNEKKPKRKTGPDTFRKYTSGDYRRTHPTFRYFCELKFKPRCDECKEVEPRCDACGDVKPGCDVCHDDEPECDACREMKPGCRAYQNEKSDVAGFATREDMRRHLLLHKPTILCCNWPHKSGVDYRGRRADNLRK